MPTQNYKLAVGSLYRTPLRLMEAMGGSDKRAWDLGYHHGIRGHAPRPDDSDDAELYMKGYGSGKGESASPLKDYTRETEFDTDIEGRREHLKLPDWANVPTYQLGENIKSGAGMRPGDFASIVYNESEYSDAEAEARSLAPAFQEYGQSIVDSDQELSELWSASMKSRDAAGARPLALDTDPADDMEAHQAELTFDRDREVAGFAMAQACAQFGKSLIPPEEYEQRKRSFSRSITRKIGKFGIGVDRQLTDWDMQKVGLWSESLFDALGPAAEETLERGVRRVVLAGDGDDPNEADWYLEDKGVMRVSSKSGFFHEFGHALEHVIHGSNTDDPSYWSSRVQNKDSSPPTPLGMEGVDDDGVTKKDHWADPYIGKVYYAPSWSEDGEDDDAGIASSSEVLSVFMEGLSSYDSSYHWANQIKKDPQALLEVMGYLRSSIEGVHQAKLAERREADELMKVGA